MLVLGSGFRKWRRFAVGLWLIGQFCVFSDFSYSTRVELKAFMKVCVLCIDLSRK